ncbi:Protein of unknown function [Spirosomataceae bacterium TFI 002]|nr:Protein of unknown function [Spirosomataceae bacterium TFI 002]
MSKKSFALIIICFCCLNFVEKANAQQLVGLRAGATVEKKISKKFSVTGEAQLRYTDNFEYLQTYLAELGVAYKFNKQFELGAYYRFFNKRKEEEKDWKTRHRFYGELKYDKKIGPIKFEDRLRYQHQFKDNDGEVGFDKSYLRNKFELNYPNKSRFTPYVSADFFYLIGEEIDQVRLKSGVSFKLDKSSSLNFGVFKDLGVNGGIVDPNLILNLNYKFKF